MKAALRSEKVKGKGPFISSKEIINYMVENDSHVISREIYRYTATNIIF